MKKIFIAFFASFILASFLIGCGETNTQHSVVGSWSNSSQSSNNANIIFEADGTIRIPAYDGFGSWSLDENDNIIITEGDDTTTTTTYTLKIINENEIEINGQTLYRKNTSSSTPLENEVVQATPAEKDDSAVGNETLQYFTENETFKYNVYESYVEITGCNLDEDTTTEITIPDAIEGLPVRVIGEEAFGYMPGHQGWRADLSTIDWGKYVNVIKSYAFSGTYETLDIPDSVTLIEQYAFRSSTYIPDTSYLGNPYLKEITIHNKNTRIENYAFIHESSQKSSLTLYGHIGSTAVQFCADENNSSAPAPDHFLFHYEFVPLEAS